MILSIIIPVYNVERYIEECVLSFMKQGVDANLYEVIIVDDGSTDGSLNIAHKLKAEYSNVRVVSKINGGVASARNYGYNLAVGKYVFFVDADDKCAEGSFNALMKCLADDTVDCLLVKQFRTDESLNILPLNPIEQYYFLSFPSDTCANLLDKISILDFPFRHVVNREFLSVNKLYYTEEITTYEDVLWALRVYTLAKRIKVFDVPVYLYRMNLSSVTGGTYDAAKQERDLKNMLWFLHYVRDNELICDKNMMVYNALYFRLCRMLLCFKVSTSLKKSILPDIKSYRINFMLFCKDLYIRSHYFTVLQIFASLLIYGIYMFFPLYKFLSLRRSYSI